MILVLILPIVRPIRAGYSSISLYVVVEVVLLFVAPRFGGDAWLAPIGWGIIAVLAAIADVGADLRRALEARATPAQTPRSSDAEAR